MAELGTAYVKLNLDYSSVVEGMREIARAHQALAAQAGQLADYLESKTEHRDWDEEYG